MRFSPPWQLASDNSADGTVTRWPTRAPSSRLLRKRTATRTVGGESTGRLEGNRCSRLPPRQAARSATSPQAEPLEACGSRGSWRPAPRLHKPSPPCGEMRRGDERCRPQKCGCGPWPTWIPRFDGHLTAGPSGLAWRMSVDAQDCAVFAGVRACGRATAQDERPFAPTSVHPSSPRMSGGGDSNTEILRGRTRHARASMPDETIVHDRDHDLPRACVQPPVEPPGRCQHEANAAV